MTTNVGSTPANWFEDFFHGVANDVWKKCMSPEETRAEADFIERALDRQPSARLLDVPCGYGRHSLELASRGYVLTGMDISPDYIEEAWLAAKTKARRVEWVRADMRQLDRVAEFDGVFCFGNSFGYLQHGDTEIFLAAVARSLQPGGRFLLQTFAAAECLLPHFKEREWYQIQDILFAIENHYRVETSCLETEFTFVRGGKTETRRGLQHIYTVAEIKRLLSGAGLETVALLGSLDARPFKFGDEMLCVVAQKPE